MELQQRIELLVRLGEYMQNNNEIFESMKQRAHEQNPWFTYEFIDLAIMNICNEFLQKNKLEAWIKSYPVRKDALSVKKVGVVMAGNIPLVNFHDLLCTFLSGNSAVIKPSSKDEVLIKHLVQKMYEWEVTTQDYISFAENLKGCDAYIVTGSNNSGRYFEYYFGRYPGIIRRNKTSVALLDGNETREELALLADDIQLYFGLGCRNVTKIYVPNGYDFLPLLEAIKKYDYFMDFYKYKNNYDYQLALLIMNNKYYMSDGSVLLTESESLFSPISRVNYTFYEDRNEVDIQLKINNDIQCIVGHKHIPFGMAQSPGLNSYADKIDTMQFLCEL